MQENILEPLLETAQEIYFPPKDKAQKNQGKFNTIEEALSYVGDKNKFQYLVFFLFSLQWAIGTIVLISGPFIFKVPTFNCNGKECTEDYGGCEGGVVNEDSANSITTTFKLYCDQGYLRTLAEAGVYIGSSIGLAFYSVVAMSRKVYLLSSWITTSVGLLILPFSSNVTMLIFILVLVGFGVNPGLTIHITILDEQCGDKLRQLFMTGLFIAWGLAEILMAVIIYFIPDWKYFIWFFLCLPAFLMSIANFLIPESPKYMYIYDKQKAIAILNKIAKINGKEPISSPDDLSDFHTKENRKKYSLIDLLRYRSIRLPNILTAFAFFVVQLVYFGSVYAVPDIGVNIYLNTIISAVAELIGYVSAGFIILRFKRRFLIVTTLFITSIFCILFYFLVVPDDCVSSTCTMKIVQLLFSMFARFMTCICLIAVYCYMPEIFPTSVRTIGVSFLSVFGTMGNICAPYLVNLSKVIDLNPMVLIGLIGVGGSLVSLFLKETKENRAGEEIQELLIANNSLMKNVDDSFTNSSEKANQKLEQESLNTNL